MEQAPSNRTPTLLKIMNMGIWVIGTSSQLFIWGLNWDKSSYRQTSVIFFAIGPFCTPHCICLNVNLVEILTEATIYFCLLDESHFSNIESQTVECIEINWLCIHRKKVRSSQSSISIIFVLSWVKHRFPCEYLNCRQEQQQHFCLGGSKLLWYCDLSSSSIFRK